MAYDTLDAAIRDGRGTEEERCANRDCDWCHPGIAPDEQARAEVNAHLNRVDVLATRGMLEERLALLEGRERAKSRLIYELFA